MCVLCPDQMARGHGGGQMGDYWLSNPMPVLAESFVIERMGGEHLRFRGCWLSQPESELPPFASTASGTEEEGRSRQSECMTATHWANCLPNAASSLPKPARRMNPTFGNSTSICSVSNLLARQIRAIHFSSWLNVCSASPRKSS